MELRLPSKSRESKFGVDEEDAEMIRTRESIEGKMRKKDYIGARSLVLETLKVFPRFNQSSEMLTVCDILYSAEMELPGFGIDWYWVLQLFTTAEPAAIEAQYQKIVSQLTPIKNDFPDTELALKFAGDAFSVLSDPTKRAAFDSKRNIFLNVCEDSNLPNSSRAKRAADEVCHENEDNDDVKKKKRTICAEEAIWVADQVHLKRNDLQNEEIPLTQMRLGKDYYDFENSRKTKLFTTGQIWVAYDQDHMPRRYGRMGNTMTHKPQFYVTWFKACPQQAHEKKWHDARFPISCGAFDLELNKITFCGPLSFSHMLSNGITNETLEIYPEKGDVWAIYSDWDVEWCAKPEMRKRCAFELVEVITDYSKDSGARVAYLVRVDGFKNVYQRFSKRGNELSFHIPSHNLLMFSHKVPAFRFMGGEIVGVSNGMLELDPLAVPNNLVQNFSSAMVALMDSSYLSTGDIDCIDEASITNLTNPSLSTIETGGSSSKIQTKKSKFTAKDLMEEQVWAVYGGPSSLPQTYVKINYVVSPNIVLVTFLEPHPVLDEEIIWVEENLTLVCGIFRAGKVDMLDISKFSHLVECDRSLKKSFYRIFPRKGETWAVYNNWNVNWNSSDLNESHCHVVEILSDFSEKNGVMVCSLVEVKGFMTFFQKKLHDGFELTRELSRLELLSFSHRIPALTVVGIKNQEIPNGSLHLEPDALPPKLMS